MTDRKKRVKTAEEKDPHDEGRARYEVDVDRMMNEGMAGGNVFVQGDRANIEETHEIVEDQPSLE